MPKLRFRVISETIWMNDPPTTDDGELDEDAIMDNEEFEILTPVCIEEFLEGKMAFLFLPPGGALRLNNGVMVENNISPTTFAICPRCKNWWNRRGPSRPQRCPICNERLNKYPLEQIELTKFMSQGKMGFTRSGGSLFPDHDPKGTGDTE